jgi:Matrixin
MARRALLAAVTAALVAAAPAAAAERGLDLGRAAFGTPVCGVPAIERATFADPAVMAGADPESCRILLNRRWADEMPRAMRCTLVFHEFGHLAGREHSDDPDSIMYASYWRPDERCLRFSALSRARPAAGTSGSGPSSP